MYAPISSRERRRDERHRDAPAGLVAEHLQVAGRGRGMGNRAGTEVGELGVGEVVGRVHEVDDRGHVLGQPDAGAVGVDRLQTGQRHGGDVVPDGLESGDDAVPRPGAEPETGN
ncbi:hypothetical protein [Aeromicrobium wangtongii]|uniref:Uncharacterized protein n=1 Tax=Aeromicrobium wangtongii TaxID=2969247 RepID=A0ABY5MDI5_9ACTN|nr:hypothetical protein [Aeromicrobium wangtongii]MCD9197579.1 hypothetical protein [Aeromicrobium wangtongii]UUP15070.1 hypothetical protein NQV15_07085 [Aeromicrobium wangtongii]